MMSPATIDDLFSIIPRKTDSVWRDILASDNISNIIELNKLMVFSYDGLPYGAVGVGSLPLTKVSIPWVWGVVDVSGPKVLKRFLREDIEPLRAYLDCHAKGAYTVPEEDTPRFTKFLRLVGFVPLGWGLWQWRK